MNSFIKKFNWLIKKPTLFSIVGPLILVWAILFFIYLLIYENGGELEGLFVFLLILLSAGIVVIDRVFAELFNNKLLSAAELLISIAFYILCLYWNREIIIDLNNSNKPYVVIIDNPNGISLEKIKHSGLFNRTVTVQNSDCLIINEASFGGFEMTYNNKKWNIMSIIAHKKPYYKYNCTFVANENINYSDSQIDSIIKAKIITTK